MVFVTVGLWLGLGAAHGQVLDNPRWSELSPAERQALQPLQSQWNSIDAVRKQKWRDIASRYASMSAEQKERTSSRMAEWAAMSPAQRNAARLQFEQVKQMPSTERQARWDAYQSLPAEQRDALSRQAKERTPPPRTGKAPAPADEPTPKSNIVDATRATAKPKAVAPATVQAGVGASTRPITQSPTPPRHQQAGMPKIATTPGFVDSATLLPRRGPQGAAAEPPRESR